MWAKQVFELNFIWTEQMKNTIFHGDVINEKQIGTTGVYIMNEMI